MSGSVWWRRRRREDGVGGASTRRRRRSLLHPCKDDSGRSRILLDTALVGAKSLYGCSNGGGAAALSEL